MNITTIFETTYFPTLEFLNNSPWIETNQVSTDCHSKSLPTESQSDSSTCNFLNDQSRNFLKISPRDPMCFNVYELPIFSFIDDFLSKDASKYPFQIIKSEYHKESDDHSINELEKNHTQHPHRSILKKSGIVKTEKKQLSWSKTSHVRILKINKEIIESHIIEGESSKFFHENGTSHLKKKRNDYPRYQISLTISSPNDVREIKFADKIQLEDLDIEEIQGIYLRLIKKQEVIYKLKNDIKFQETVNEYIQEYLSELEERDYVIESIEKLTNDYENHFVEIAKEILN